MRGLTRVTVAWGAILAAGISLALTGQFDLYGTYGEKLVQAVGLGAAGLVVYVMGDGTRSERGACRFMLAAALVTSLAYPFADRLTFYGLVGLTQLGLCAQLGAWRWAARKTHYALGLFLVWLGMMLDTLIILPWAQLQEVDPTCGAGMRLTCINSAEVAMALPSAVTVALGAIWLWPLRDRLGRI